MSRHTLLHCQCETCRREHFESFVVTAAVVVMVAIAVLAWCLAGL